MIESIKVLGDGAQITLIICSTIVILSILVLIVGLIYCLCRCPKKDCKEGKNITDIPKPNNPANPVASQESHNQKSEFEKEDRAKALVKDFYEATRVKTTYSDNRKEEKCDITVAQELIKEYKSLLNSKNEGSN